MLGKKALSNIVKKINGTQFIWLEDIFITGLVRIRARVKLIDIENNHFVKRATKSFVNGNKFFCVECKSKNLLTVWNKIMRYQQKKLNKA